MMCELLDSSEISSGKLLYFFTVLYSCLLLRCMYNALIFSSISQYTLMVATRFLVLLLQVLNVLHCTYIEFNDARKINY